MLHRVYFTIVNGEGWLLEPSRKCSPFYMVRERRLGELVQCPAHAIVSQAPRRWAFAPTPLVVLFFMRKCLTWGSPRSLSIVIVTFIVGGYVRPRTRSPLLCMVQLSLQIIYLSLHGPLIVLFLRYMAPNFFWLRGPGCYFVSGARDCPRESSFCWFKWCLHFPLETFHSLHFDHVRG